MKTESEISECIFQIENEIKYWQAETHHEDPPEGYISSCQKIVRQYNHALMTLKWVLSPDAKFPL